MGYLILGIVLGVVVDRYVLPILDMFLELLNNWMLKLYASIQIDTSLMSLDYQEIAEQGNQLTPLIGFTGERQAEGLDYLDDDDDESSKIGFIK